MGGYNWESIIVWCTNSAWIAPGLQLPAWKATTPERLFFRRVFLLPCCSVSLQHNEQFGRSLNVEIVCFTLTLNVACPTALINSARHQINSCRLFLQRHFPNQMQTAWTTTLLPGYFLQKLTRFQLFCAAPAVQTARIACFESRCICICICICIWQTLSETTESSLELWQKWPAVFDKLGVGTFWPQHTNHTQNERADWHFHCTLRLVHCNI